MRLASPPCVSPKEDAVLYLFSSTIYIYISVPVIKGFFEREEENRGSIHSLPDDGASPVSDTDITQSVSRRIYVC